MHDHPSASAILEAATEALRSDAPLTKFDRRVIANALSIAARELAQDPAEAADHDARLTALVGEASTDKLARAIANGDLAETPELVDHLWRTTMAKLAVDQPTFPLYTRLTAKGDAP
ncbi:MAG: DUF6285 domain-containing protein [Pseudomonadota bacterium]